MGESRPDHRQTAFRLGFGRFVLKDIPVFREEAVGHADDIDSEPISSASAG